LIWRNTILAGLRNIASTMEHRHVSSAATLPLPPERAPLTRLRASARPAPPPPPIEGSAGARALLPDARSWGELFAAGPVPVAEAQALNDAGQVRRVAAGMMVFHQGEPARALVMVQGGDVALGMRGEEGSFRTERHVHGPSWLDLSAGWLGETHALDARAMTLVTVVEWSREALWSVVERHPALALRLILALAREARSLAANTHELMHKDAPGRLAAWLNSHCHPVADAPGRGVVQLPMRKRDIASQLAITPETLSRLMRSFTGQGIIQVAGYTVHVLDRSALEKLAGA
jgi:CRP-like cAMP-binding protein